LCSECRKNGLGITIHTGEVTGAAEVTQVVNLLNPDRIGHGIASVTDEKLLAKLAEQGTVLEICPSSNIHTGVVENISTFKEIFSELKKFRVPFTINTDGPEMLGTNLVAEYNQLLQQNILTNEDLHKATKTAKRASFIK